ncbi:High-affinity zinc uptake system binding-protein ZnuA precursor [Paraliobacillus sp. PM-2]|uniref:metal ABC transporter solute-binding protein, Zn/Mn family n=1 Tax=Paraliobacillus sp. PM-2 TaxID=1462524 RepID=UPI00061C7659|nr:zinc ABC transporter substrate-binding protein [Paraliobacillus sp. PM-2]CQR47077.1 High-affinity zinc uptake system binding-protein ZnuA precursor [Paraliobacillus sp. PM-2]
MKKTKAFLLLISSLLSLLFVTACNEQEATQNDSNTLNEEKLEIYTTIYPLAFFTSEIGGSYVDVTSILPAGADPHTFEPTSKMMVDIAEADAFIYNGANLESYADSIKDALAEEDVRMIEAATELDLLAYSHHHSDDSENANSHEEEKGHGDTESDNNHEQDSHDHGDIDPHVWLDPMLAIKLAETIKDELITQIPKQEKTLEANYQKLANKLTELDRTFHDTLKNGEKKEILVAHAAYGYWEKAYGIEQIAITGLSSSDEPSQKEVEKILEQVKEYGINHLFFEQNVSSRLASVIQNEAGIKALHLHNLEVLTQKDIDNNETYFTIMNKNLKSLKKALE